jgi:hypothetical protein
MEGRRAALPSCFKDSEFNLKYLYVEFLGESTKRGQAAGLEGLEREP